MEDIDLLLNDYKPGSPENKPDVTQQILKIKETREKQIQEEMKKQQDYDNFINNINQRNNPQANIEEINIQDAQNKLNQLSFMVHELSMENNQLKDKVKYLEDKIKQLITESIQLKRNSK